MGRTAFSLRTLNGSNRRFNSNSLAEALHPTRDSGPITGEKTCLKLLLELANQTVSHQELRDILCAVMRSIRSSVRCDGVCIFLKSAENEELRVYAVDVQTE